MFHDKYLNNNNVKQNREQKEVHDSPEVLDLSHTSFLGHPRRRTAVVLFWRNDPYEILISGDQELTKTALLERDAIQAFGLLLERPFFGCIVRPCWILLFHQYYRDFTAHHITLHHNSSHRCRRPVNNISIVSSRNS